MRRLLVLAVILASACGSAREFADEPIVWRVEDRLPISEPEVREFQAKRYFADVLLLDRITEALAFRGSQPAANTNAIDEVPDSTWFTNRIGLFDYTPEEVAEGPASGPPPQPPYVIVAGKSGGGNPGFIAQDTLGRRFLFKFDPTENPEMQTATNVIVNRFFWAAGYNVPADYVFFFTIDELSIAQGTEFEDDHGVERELTMRDIRVMLGGVPHQDGKVRATASLFLTGVPKGGFSPLGVRRDDPNDTTPHELRRELRGLRALSAWLGHTDMKEDNTLDMYVGPGYLKHYFVDFGEALGAHQAEKLRWEDGWEHVWDWQRNTLAAVTFGLWKRPWEDTAQTPWASIGAFASDPFEPRLWREAYPYFPFMYATAPDLYWGAKIVMRFRRPHIAAVVAEGQFTSSEAAAYLVETLVERRDKVGREWLDPVTALDYLEVRGDQICGLDLPAAYGIRRAGLLEVLRPRGKRATKSIQIAKNGAVCFDAPKTNGYHLVRLRIVRDDGPRPPMQVHVRGGDNPRILGILRTERWE